MEEGAVEQEGAVEERALGGEAAMAEAAAEEEAAAAEAHAEEHAAVEAEAAGIGAGAGLADARASEIDVHASAWSTESNFSSIRLAVCSSARTRLAVSTVTTCELATELFTCFTAWITCSE